MRRVGLDGDLAGHRRFGELLHHAVDLGVRDRRLLGGRRHRDRAARAGLHLAAVGVHDTARLGLRRVDALARLAVDGDGLAGRELDRAVAAPSRSRPRRPAGRAGSFSSSTGIDGLDLPVLPEERADDGDRVVVAARPRPGPWPGCRTGGPPGPA